MRVPRMSASSMRMLMRKVMAMRMSVRVPMIVAVIVAVPAAFASNVPVIVLIVVHRFHYTTPILFTPLSLSPVSPMAFASPYYAV